MRRSWSHLRWRWLCCRVTKQLRLPGSSHFVPTTIGLKSKFSLSTDRVVVFWYWFQAVLTYKEHLIAFSLVPQFTLNILPEMPDHRWKGRFWTMSRKLQLKVILKLICQQLTLHKMIMIFSALWIQQEERQQVLQWLDNWSNSWNQTKPAYCLSRITHMLPEYSYRPTVHCPAVQL